MCSNFQVTNSNASSEISCLGFLDHAETLYASEHKGNCIKYTEVYSIWSILIQLQWLKHNYCFHWPTQGAVSLSVSFLRTYLSILIVSGYTSRAGRQGGKLFFLGTKAHSFLWPSFGNAIRCGKNPPPINQK